MFRSNYPSHNSIFSVLVDFFTRPSQAAHTMCSAEDNVGNKPDNVQYSCIYTMMISRSQDFLVTVATRSEVLSFLQDQLLQTKSNDSLEIFPILGSMDLWRTPAQDNRFAQLNVLRKLPVERFGSNRLVQLGDGYACRSRWRECDAA
jgi:hypothetical protein